MATKPAAKATATPKATTTKTPASSTVSSAITNAQSPSARAAADKAAAAQAAAKAAANQAAAKAAAAKAAAQAKANAAKTAADKTAADKAAADAAAAEEAARKLQEAEDKINELNAKLATLDAQAKSDDAKTLTERTDAFAAIRKTMMTYNFTEAEMKEVDSYITSTLTNPRIGPEQAIINMRDLNAYKARFAGNEARVKAGKNALSEADYLAQEDSYLQYLKAGGVDSLGNRALYADLIAGSVAPDEVGKRVNIAVNRVQKSDPEIKKQLQAFYPNITDKDLVAYFLAPDAALVDLERKATAAEIGAAAYGKGFNVGTTEDEIALYRKSAEDLAAYGVDRAGALQGYANVAEVLPTARKLSGVYNEEGIDYNQAASESEFFKGNVKAAEQRKRLKSLERAAFEGASGVSSQAGSLNRGTTGSF